MTYDQHSILDAIRITDLAILQDLASHWDDFPSGKDDTGEHWLIHAICRGTLETVQWMLSQGATPLIDAPDDGYTVLHTAIERDGPEKYPIMRALIAAGADVYEFGIHGYAPAHLAAVRNDVEALRVLYESHADFTLRTIVDDYYTPLEEARSLNALDAEDAIRYLESLERQSSSS